VFGRKLMIRCRPRGLVGVIGPWNYPLINSFGDCIPALAAGNAAILKPASATPMTSLLMAEMLDDCGLPEGIFQVATGGSATAEALIDEVDFIQFTGSTETGKKVMARAAQTLTPVGLELGGKDPMIVLADADLERAANAATYYSMCNGGQVCISVERVYVEEPVYDEFVSKVAEKVGKLRQGVPGGPGQVDVGAVTTPPQVSIIDEHVKDAVAKGARVLTGGKPGPGPGAFYEPTVLADVNHTMEAMTEETFGPTVPIMKVRDADEAVRLANDSPYGLAASVWTRDIAKGEALARRVEAGAVCVNDAQINYVALELPMGGWKDSGLGSRHAEEGIRKYCAQQSILVTRLAPKKEPQMFPYRGATTKLLGRVIKLIYGRGRRD
jgi:acyl-CoA reductase-like NAD-dependent aldehyde dehydrogenase